MLGGEFGDWLGKRPARGKWHPASRSMPPVVDKELKFGLCVTGTIHPDRIVQICDPVSGVPLPVGEPGEIVVTTLTQGWPLIRFGTGDVAYATAMHADGTVRRISMLQGRVGQSVKAREIFIYPRQLEDLAIAVTGIVRAQAVVTRPRHREEITLRLTLTPDADREAVLAAVPERFNALPRLKADHVETVSADALPADAPFVVDRKDT